MAAADAVLVLAGRCDWRRCARGVRISCSAATASSAGVDHDIGRVLTNGRTSAARPRDLTVPGIPLHIRTLTSSYEQFLGAVGVFGDEGSCCGKSEPSEIVESEADEAAG